MLERPEESLRNPIKRSLLLQSSIPIKSLPDKKRLGEAVVNMFIEEPDIRKTIIDTCRAAGLYGEVVDKHPGFAKTTLEKCTKAIAGKTDEELKMAARKGLEEKIGAILTTPPIEDLSPEELRIARKNMEDLISIYSIMLSNKPELERAQEFAQESQKFRRKGKVT